MFKNNYMKCDTLLIGNVSPSLSPAHVKQLGIFLQDREKIGSDDTKIHPQ